MEKQINRWEFKKELLRIPSKIKKLKNETAKKHLRQLFEKYESLISYNYIDRKRDSDYRQAFNALRGGKIRFNRGGYDCHINISHITSVYTTEKQIIVNINSGLEERFCIEEFSYLLILFG